MANKVWTFLEQYNTANIYDVDLDATDAATFLQGLDHTQALTIAIATTGTAAVDVILQFENPKNGSPKQFTFASGAGTVSSADWVRSAVGPITGIRLVGTITGGDAVAAQIIQTVPR